MKVLKENLWCTSDKTTRLQMTACSKTSFWQIPLQTNPDHIMRKTPWALVIKSNRFRAFLQYNITHLKHYLAISKSINAQKSIAPKMQNYLRNKTNLLNIDLEMVLQVMTNTGHVLHYWNLMGLKKNQNISPELTAEIFTQSLQKCLLTLTLSAGPIPLRSNSCGVLMAPPARITPSSQ